MRLFRLIFLNFIFLFFSCSLFSMVPNDNQKKEPELSVDFQKLSISDQGYDSDLDGEIDSGDSGEEDFSQSDSEDEENYKYKGCDNLKISGYQGKRCIVFYRGIHFSPNNFGKQQISKLRRSSEIEKPIFSTATYDLANLNIKEDINLDDEEILNSLLTVSEELKKQINKLTKDQRNKFQQLYTNQYNKFHAQLKNLGFKSNKNPQVSTSESFRHAGKYAYGQKFIGDGVKLLDPWYDENGKAKHPYLGKIYIILIDSSKIKELDPYFVVYGHANKKIKIFTHFSNNILSEREVSFAGFIPGECVVFEQIIRVPSTITGEYKTYYESKYGLSKRSFSLMKNKIEAINEILKNLPNIDKLLLNRALNQVSDKESIVGGFFDKDEVSKNLKAVEVDQLKKILADRKKDIIKN
ncbi:MAG: hypothetical protein ABIA74_01455, partial [bacterium]